MILHTECTVHYRSESFENRFCLKPTLSLSLTRCSVPLLHIDGAESEEEELVTVVEKDKRDIGKNAIIVTDKYRTMEKILMSGSLEDFLNQGIEIAILS